MRWSVLLALALTVLVAESRNPEGRDRRRHPANSKNDSSGGGGFLAFLRKIFGFFKRSDPADAASGGTVDEPRTAPRRSRLERRKRAASAEEASLSMASIPPPLSERRRKGAPLPSPKEYQASRARSLEGLDRYFRRSGRSQEADQLAQVAQKIRAQHQEADAAVEVRLGWLPQLVEGRDAKLAHQLQANEDYMRRYAAKRTECYEKYGYIPHLPPARVPYPEVYTPIGRARELKYMREDWRREGMKQRQEAYEKDLLFARARGESVPDTKDI